MADIFSLLKERKTQDIIDEINKNSALADLKDGNGTSLLLLSVYYGNQELKEYLFTKKKTFDVFEAAACGLLEEMKSLAKESAGQINAFAPDGFSPLGLASFFSQNAMAEFLVTSGADVNQPSKNSFKVAPLNSAAAAKDIAIATLLLEHGADVNVKQQEGFTPLHSAAHNGDLRMAKLLLGFEADKRSKTEKGKTPYDFAVEADHKELMELLKV